MKFKYEDPLERDYVKTKCTKRILSKVLKNRKFYWHDKVEVYFTDNYGKVVKEVNKERAEVFLIHVSENNLTRLVCTILLPLAFLWNLSSVKETWKSYTDLFNQKQKGKYRADFISSESKVRELKKVLGIGEGG